MHLKKIFYVLVLGSLFMSGCATTNSVPYKASMVNVITIQNTLGEHNKKIAVGKVTIAPGTEENLICRLAGPIKVSPGKTIPEYVKEAFVEELFMAKAYDPKSKFIVNAEIERIKFSSVSPASWDITLLVYSNNSPGYRVSTHYPFGTSWDAYSACKNVANAFGPAVQKLLSEVVNHPKFITLAE